MASCLRTPVPVTVNPVARKARQSHQPPDPPQASLGVVLMGTWSLSGMWIRKHLTDTECTCHPERDTGRGK